MRLIGRKSEKPKWSFFLGIKHRFNEVKLNPSEPRDCPITTPDRIFDFFQQEVGLLKNRLKSGQLTKENAIEKRLGYGSFLESRGANF
ncbi:hypothetical protein Tco_0553146 [Tanacetum coccineum]